MDLFTQLGNARVNAILELHLGLVEKLTSTASVEERVVYLSAKYIELRFCNMQLAIPGGRFLTAKYMFEHDTLTLTCDTDSQDHIDSICRSVNGILPLLHCIMVLYGQSFHNEAHELKDVLEAIREFFARRFNFQAFTPTAQRFLDLNGYSSYSNI